MVITAGQVTKLLNTFISFEHNTSALEPFMAYVSHRVYSYKTSFGRTSWSDEEIPFIVDFIANHTHELQELFDYIILYDGPNASNARSRLLVEEFVIKSLIFETKNTTIIDIRDIVITDGNDNINADRDQFFKSERRRVSKRHQKKT